ncbi:50S ribosomal protein L23 [Candidatus Woesebacteria bacterium]|jgi:ribosomal protein L23|nr:50S ribosomal protein L23 [Candidatus Woesebacteria bacterium]MBP9687076.1 50S ribosomal protein L23 [Candidatus Woesebacteria bacterium]
MIKPILTEKSLTLSRVHKFTFRVPKNLSKYQIASEVARLFNVHPTEVTTVNYKKGVRRTMKGRYVNVPAYKKAIVTVKDNETIAAFGSDKK